MDNTLCQEQVFLNDVIGFVKEEMKLSLAANIGWKRRKGKKDGAKWSTP